MHLLVHDLCGVCVCVCGVWCVCVVCVCVCVCVCVVGACLPALVPVRVCGVLCMSVVFTYRVRVFIVCLLLLLLGEHEKTTCTAWRCLQFVCF